MVEKPISALALTGYLRTRGERLGYPETINFMSIRRRSATDLTRLIGRDATRTLMNHDPDSRILEKWYLDFTPTTDLMNLALGNTNDLGQESMDLLKRANPLAIGAISHDPAALAKLHGPALNALVSKIMASAPMPDQPRRQHEQTLFRRRVQYAAKKILLSEQVQKQRETLKLQEYQERVQAIGKSSFMEEILKLTRKALEEAPDDIDIDDDAVDQETGMFVEDVPDELAEEDLEDQDDTLGQDSVQVQVDEEEYLRSPDAESEVPYADAAKTFMEILLQGSLSQHNDYKNNPVHCPLCEQDETIPRKFKVNRRNPELLS